MPFENEYANTATASRLFGDTGLQDKIQDIHTQMTSFDLDDTEVDFQHYASDKSIKDYNKLISIDGSITPTVEIDNIPYRIVRIVIVEMDPEEHIQLNMETTYDFDRLYNITENLTEIHIPFLDFEHPESSTKFDTFVRQQLNDIELYTQTIGESIENATNIQLQQNGGYEITCKKCGTTQKVTSMDPHCQHQNCNHTFDKYTPLQFFNGYRPEEFMVFMENLALLNVMDEETNSLIIKDGPLSQAYTPSGYIKNAFQYTYEIPKEIGDGSYEMADTRNHVFGLEKSGRFQSILDDIDIEDINKPAVASLPEEVLTHPGDDGKALYGEPTHFGKRFFICPYDNTRYTVYVPRLPRHERDELKSNISDYEPEIAVSIKLVQRYMSPRYDNSLFPVIIANQHASLPKNAQYEHYLKRTLADS